MGESWLVDISHLDDGTELIPTSTAQTRRPRDHSAVTTATVRQLLPLQTGDRLVNECASVVYIRKSGHDLVPLRYGI